MSPDALKALFLISYMAVFLGSLLVPRLRVPAGLLFLGLCTATVVAVLWARAVGRDASLADVWFQLLLVGGIGVAEVAWGHRTTRGRPVARAKG